MVVNASVVPSVTIVGAPTTVCVGDPVTFTATPINGGTTPSYQWQVNGVNAGTNSATFVTSSLANGANVTVTLTSNSPCASPTTDASNVVTIIVNTCNKPVANFSATPRVMCQAGCVNFTDLSTNSPTTWSWQFPGASPSSSTAQNPTNICYSSNGSYDVTLIVSNASGADTLTQVGYITVGAPVQVTIAGNLLINSCEKTELTAIPSDGSYSWGPNVNLSSTSGATVTAAPTTTQQYWVTYTSPEGCTDSDTVIVVVADINTYFLPTGLTPNGDGVNDEIHLHGRGIESFSLKIFDRIGEQVFQTTSMEKGWDGRLLGVPMNDGVFVYTLNITFCNGENVKKYGDITLVK
jgi:gliding motility-associated-like protein